MVHRVKRLFGPKCKLTLLADREFLGNDWFNYLKQQGIQPLIRLKKDTLLTAGTGKKSQVQFLFRKLKPGKFASSGARLVYGANYVVSAYRNFQKELIAVVHQDGRLSPKEVLGEYATRWKIESLFQHLKSRGFDLEKTRLTRPTRLQKLIATTALATFGALKSAHLDYPQGPPPQKNSRLRKSMFNLGLEAISAALILCVKSPQKLEAYVLLLRPPQTLTAPAQIQRRLIC
jgi:hypothetical protein